MRQHTVFLIASEEMGWAELRSALHSIDSVRVIGEANTVYQAARLAATMKPNFIISAAEIEGTSTAPLLSEIHRRARSSTRFLVFATHIAPAEFAALDALNLAGYLLWGDLSTEALKHCLAAALAGDVVVSSRRVAEAYIETRCRPDHCQPYSFQLTQRERIVLRGLAEGLTRQELAMTEGISVRTVERVVASLEAKLDASNVVVLGVRACRLGIVG